MCAPALSGISPCTESRRRAPLSGDVNVYVDPHEKALRNKALGLDPDATLPTKVNSVSAYVLNELLFQTDSKPMCRAAC